MHLVKGELKWHNCCSKYCLGKIWTNGCLWPRICYELVLQTVQTCVGAHKQSSHFTEFNARVCNKMLSHGRWCCDGDSGKIWWLCKWSLMVFSVGGALSCNVSWRLLLALRSYLVYFLRDISFRCSNWRFILILLDSEMHKLSVAECMLVSQRWSSLISKVGREEVVARALWVGCLDSCCSWITWVVLVFFARLF